MNHLSRAALLAALCLSGVPALAQASEATLTITMGGEAYDGPPKFSVSFDGKVVGDGVVDKAIDTAAKGRFADANDRKPFVESFDFAIPEAEFKAGGEIRIKFTNEAYGGDGSNRDRNLFISSVTLNGQTVTPEGMTTVTAKGVSPNVLVGDYLEIKDGTADAVIPAPKGGWPQATIAASAPAAGPDAGKDAVPVVAATAPAKADYVPQADTSIADTRIASDVVEPQDDASHAVTAEIAPKKPVEQAPQPATHVATAVAPAKPSEAPPIPAPPKAVAMAKAPAAPVTPMSEADVALADSQNKPVVQKASAKADLAEAAPGDANCGRSVLYNVVGFNESSNELTPRLTQRLDQIIKDIGNEECMLMVTGYSSTRGENATNALFAIERAQNVLGYLKANGVKYARAQASGVGATSKFGPAPYANRRVVVTISP